MSKAFHISNLRRRLVSASCGMLALRSSHVGIILDTPLLGESALGDGYQVVDMFVESNGEDL